MFEESKFSLKLLLKYYRLCITFFFIYTCSEPTFCHILNSMRKRLQCCLTIQRKRTWWEHLLCSQLQLLTYPSLLLLTAELIAILLALSRTLTFTDDVTYIISD